jgi:hypothetical protein
LILEQIQNSRRVARIVQGAVFLRKTALGCIDFPYINSEFAMNWAVWLPAAGKFAFCGPRNASSAAA